MGEITLNMMKSSLLFTFALVLVSQVSAGGVKPALENAWTRLVAPLAWDQQCKDTCCRNGGGAACVSACGCSGACPSENKALSCDQQCKDTCCRNGGGAACVSACGCSGACPSEAFAALVDSWTSVVESTNGGCSKPGACGITYQGCCFGAQHSGDACTCKLTDGDGEVGTSCSGTDKAGACGVAYTACCAAYKIKGEPCTCDVESP